MEAIGHLSGGIAHDFNNLLMIVIGNLENAQRQTRGAEAINPNLQRAINNAMRGAQRAAALTSRLLAFSRRQPLNPKPLDTNKFLTATSEFLQRSLGETIDIAAGGTPACGRSRRTPTTSSPRCSMSPSMRATRCREAARSRRAPTVLPDEGYCRGGIPSFARASTC